jgi:hypothetical protein
MNNDQLAFGNHPLAVMLTGESEQPLSIFSGLVTVQERAVPIGTSLRKHSLESIRGKRRRSPPWIQDVECHKPRFSPPEQ